MDQMPRPDARPRTRSRGSWSFNKQEEALKESPNEKRRTMLGEHTKANPNQAMNELQPNAAALEETTMTSLSSVQHMDKYGQPITEPDLSNPTRSRWERPLDTIRSFEEQCDSAYRNKRGSTIRPSPPDRDDRSGFTSRRTSYFGGFDAGQNQNSRPRGYGRARSSFGAEEAINYNRRTSYTGRDSYANYDNYDYQQDAYDQPAPPPVPKHRFQNQRMNSDRHSPHGQNGYPSHGYQQSRDTVGTGESGSHSEPWTNSTDPSSENSSVDPHPPVKQPDLGEQYGFHGFGANPILEEHPTGSQHPYGQVPPRPQGHGVDYYNARPQQAGGPPPPPPHGNYQQPVRTVGGNAAPSRGKLVRAPSSNDKRQSWFKKRFSRS